MKKCGILFIVCLLVIQPGFAYEAKPNLDRWDALILDKCNGDKECWALVKVWIWTESRGNPHAMAGASPGAAWGLMQVLGGTAYSKSNSKYWSESNRKNCRGKEDCAAKGWTEPRFDPNQAIGYGAIKIPAGVAKNKGSLPMYWICWNSGAGICSITKRYLGDSPWTQENMYEAHKKAMWDHWVEKKGVDPNGKNNVYTRQTRKVRGTVYNGFKMQSMYHDLLGTTPSNEPYSETTFDLDQSSLGTHPSDQVSPQTSSTFENYDGVAPGVLSRNHDKTSTAVIGSYVVRPATKARVNYNPQEYDILKLQVDSLQDACSGAPNLKACLLRETSKFNADSGLDWRVGSCEEGTHEVSSDVSSQLKDCLESSDMNCKCEIALPQSLGKNHDISMIRTVMSLGDENVFYAIGDSNRRHLLDVHLPLKLLQGTQAKDLSSIDISYSAENGIVTAVDILTTDLEDIDASFAPGTTLTLKKQDDALLFAQHNFASDSSPACTIKKTSYRFCVASQFSFPQYDDETRSTVTKPLTYKFAMSFVAGPPPLVTGITFENVLQREGTLAVSWDRSIKSNVDHYKVFVSDSPQFELENAQRVITVPAQVGTDEKITAKPDFTQEPLCVFDEGICDYRYPTGKGMVQLPSEGIRYALSDEKYLTIISGLSDSTEYYVRVVAYDTKEDYNDGGLYYSAIPRDTLAPGHATFTTSKNNDILTVATTAPAINSDGSELTDAVSFYRLYQSTSPFSQIPEQSYANSQDGEFTDLGKLPPGDYYVAVTALDANNNEFGTVTSTLVAVG